MKFIKRTAQKRGSQAIVVWVLKDNVQAIAFYHRQGFSLDGCHKVYQSGINLDCLRMTCQLR